MRKIIPYAVAAALVTFPTAAKAQSLPPNFIPPIDTPGPTCDRIIMDVSDLKPERVYQYSFLDVYQLAERAVNSAIKRFEQCKNGKGQLHARRNENNEPQLVGNYFINDAQPTVLVEINFFKKLFKPGLDL